MNFISTEFIVKTIVNYLQEKMWEKVAIKTITKMAPHKITLESNRVFNDFTGLNASVKKDSGTYIKDEQDNAQNIKQNYIVGTSKLVERSIRSKSEKHQEPEIRSPYYPRVSSKRVKTVINMQEKMPLPPSKNNNFVKLTFMQQRGKKDKIDETMRETKYSDINYNKTLEEARIQSQIMKDQRTAVQKKRFKEMKVFTYDFEGRLMSSGQNKGNKLKVLKMKSEFSHPNRKHSNSLGESKRDSELRVSHIVNKKFIQIQKPNVFIQMKQAKQKQLQLQREKQRQQRMAFSKRIPTVSAIQFFKQQQNKVSMGVTITEMSSRSKISGRIRDKEDKRNLNLVEFKEKTKNIQLFPDKKVKKRQTTSYFRTEGNQIEFQLDNKKRMKTQATDHSQKVVTSLSKYVKSRGVILVSNQRLYDENFIIGNR